MERSAYKDEGGEGVESAFNNPTVAFSRRSEDREHTGVMIRSCATVLICAAALVAAKPALASDDATFGGLNAPADVELAISTLQDPYQDPPLRHDPLSRLRQDEARQEARDGQRISAAQALSRVRARAGRGHHLSIEEERRGGQVVFVIMWDYENGRIGRFTVDGRFGRVSGG